MLLSSLRHYCCDTHHVGHIYASIAIQVSTRKLRSRAASGNDAHQRPYVDSTHPSVAVHITTECVALHYIYDSRHFISFWGVDDNLVCPVLS